jgi:hypothetical protein
MSDISSRRRAIENARHAKLKEAMDDYDRDVYYPARKQLVEDCLKEGHFGGRYHDNGLGWSWFYCVKCNGRYDITGPDGKEDSENE